MPDDLWRKRVIEILEFIYLGLLLRDSVVTFLFLLFTFALFHVIAKFHYTDPTGPARTFLRRNSVGSVRVSDKVRAGPFGSVRVRAGPVGPV